MSEEINILITLPLAEELINQISQVSDRFKVNMLHARDARAPPKCGKQWRCFTRCTPSRR